MRAWTAWVGGVAAVASSTALALPAAPGTAETQAYIESAANRNGMVAAFEAAAQRWLPGCAEVTTIEPRTVVYKPIRLNADGQPAGGMFRESATLRGCGLSVRANILAVALPDAPMRRISLLPGTTIGDPMLQRDALRYAFSGAQGAIPKDCRDLDVRNTEFMRYDPKNLEGKKPWREIWTVSACKVMIPVEMIFQPDADGTTVIARQHVP